MAAFTSNNMPIGTNAPTGGLPSAFGGAVDLSKLDGSVAGPGERVPTEFRVAVAGDANGTPHVLLAFGHLQWLFAPHLATDLGTVLLEAAQKAEAAARGENSPQEEEHKP
jgi:hypothetical protein